MLLLNLCEESTPNPFEVDSQMSKEEFARQKAILAKLRLDMDRADNKFDRLRQALRDNVPPHNGLPSVVPQQTGMVVDKANYVGPYRWSYIRKDVAETPEGIRAVKAAIQGQRLLQLTNTISDRINQHEKEQRAKQRAAVKSAHNPAPSQIPASQVPKMVPSGRSSVQNPYYLGALSDSYAGTPEQAPLTPSQLIHLGRIQDALKRNGIKPLTIMYYGKPRGFVNFVAINDPTNPTVVWRKYDVGGGSGQNWITLNGNRMNTTSFTDPGTTDAKQDAMLKAAGL
jgi:septum formation inhibitor MinC